MRPPLWWRSTHFTCIVYLVERRRSSLYSYGLYRLRPVYGLCIVIAYIVMAYAVMARIVAACILVIAYIVMACIVDAYIVMAYTVMPYIVMAYSFTPT